MSSSAPASQRLFRLVSLNYMSNKAKTGAALCKGGPLHTDKKHKPRRGFMELYIKLFELMILICFKKVKDI